MNHDLLVLGAGPAGWSAALQGAKLGLDVAVVEKDIRLGGACVNTGTLPSKTLRHTVQQLVSLRRAAHLGFQSFRSNAMDPLSIQDLMGPKNAVVEHHEYTIRAFFERNRVAVHGGSASFVSPHEVRVSTRVGEQVVRARNVVIATGSRPRRPEIIPFDDRVICDSDSILSIDAIPRSMAVLGSGVIGCEYACMFAALGVRVTLIDRREALLRFLDQDLHETLTQAMRNAGIRLMLGEKTQSVRVVSGPGGDQADIALASGRRVQADCMLVAAGRESNIDSLDLDRAGVGTDERGLIKVDDSFATPVEGIYAVGDVIGFPALASTSMLQGRRAVLHAAGVDLPPAEQLPVAIYTIPEISAVGLTEAECREKGIAYEIGVAHCSETPRGQIQGESDGICKLVFRRGDHVLLGVHWIGEGSSELIHAGMLLLQAGGTVDQLATSVFNYPTLSEAYRIAALDGLNRL